VLTKVNDVIIIDCDVTVANSNYKNIPLFFWRTLVPHLEKGSSTNGTTCKKTGTFQNIGMEFIRYLFQVYPGRCTTSPIFPHSKKDAARRLSAFCKRRIWLNG